MNISLDEITGTIVDCSLALHRDLGPGLHESVYEQILASMLEKRGFSVKRQVPVSFEYSGLHFEDAYRMDLVVEDKVVVELKSVERNNPLYAKQLKTYLVLADKQVGLLVNFGMSTLKEGLTRIVNKLPPSESPCLRVNRVGGGCAARSRGEAEIGEGSGGSDYSPSASPRLRVENQMDIEGLRSCGVSRISA